MSVNCPLTTVQSMLCVKIHLEAFSATVLLDMTGMELTVVSRSVDVSRCGL